MNILLITSYFPPDAHIGTTRWYRIGKVLLNRGHALHVITADNSSRWRIGCARQLGHRDIQTKSLHRIPYSVYTNLLHWFLGGVRFMSYSVPKRLMTRFHGAQFAESEFFTGKVSPIFNHLDTMTVAARRRAFFPHHSWSWGAKTAEYALRQMEVMKPDVIVATHPFPGTLRAAATLSERTGLPWIADMRDPFHNDPQLEDDWTRQRLLPLERALLEKAAAIVTINNYLADMLATSRHPEIISNCYDDSSRNLCECRVGRDNRAPLRIAYTGTMHHSHRYRDLLDSLAKLPLRQQTQSVIELDYYGRSFGRLLSWKQTLHEKGIELIDRGFVSVQECTRAQSQSDCLLVFGWKGQGHRCVMTGKVFDYLATGKPIIAITERDTALGELITRTGAGVVLDSPGEIAAFFAELRNRPALVLQGLYQSRKPHCVREYSATEAARRYEALLLDILDAKPRGQISPRTAP